MIVALADDQRVRGQVFVDYEPRQRCAAGAATDAQPLALTDGVKAQALVFPHHFAFRSLHGAGLARQVTAQELAKIPLADKTNARAVFLVEVVEAGFFGQFTYLGLLQLTQREEAARQLILL